MLIKHPPPSITLFALRSPVTAVRWLYIRPNVFVVVVIVVLFVFEGFFVLF